jgi:hypothetical protein
MTVLNGTVNPNGSDTCAWFEWGTDSHLTSYTSTLTQSIGAGADPVPVTTTLPISIAVPFYYRTVAQDSAGTAGGVISRALVLLGNDPTGGRDAYWNMYDRLIHSYAHKLDLPATVVKAIIAHESHGLGTDSCDDDAGTCAWNPSERPARAFLYEPVGIDERHTQAEPDRYAEYRLPSHPPAAGEDPYNPYWVTPVEIISGTTNLDMICYVCGYKATDACAAWAQLCSDEKWWQERYDSDGRTYYQQLWGLTHPGGTPTRQFVAQYRLASSYGLGQLVYWWHHGRIDDQAPELLYDPETNIGAMTTYLRECWQGCAESSLGEEDYSDLSPWKETVQAYNSDRCGHSYPGFWPGVQLHFALVQPALAPKDFDVGQILSPTVRAAAERNESRSFLPGSGEYEVARVVVDVKGTGESQLVALYAVFSADAVGADEGILKVFTDEAGSAVEWESPAMEGILLEGMVFTQTVPGNTSPIICATWGAGAHATRLFPFRWDGQAFQSILASGAGGQESFGFFGDAGVGISEGQAREVGRDSAQPLTVFHVTRYEYSPSTQTFLWADEETITNAVYAVYLPLVVRRQ